MVNLYDVKKAIEEVYIIADPFVIDILLAAVISNRLPLSDRPVWLLLLAPSSGSKTALLQLLDKVGSWIIPVDTLTTNTFASGMKGVEEVSLLNRAQGGVIVFKDFTTLTAMNEEGLREIMGQFRAIYDGSFNKKTGSGKNVDWAGKVGMVAGGTIAVQRKLRQYSEQGERFINYIIKQPDREEMTNRAIDNQKNIKEKEGYLKDLVAEFINDCLVKVATTEVIITTDFQRDMVKVANFCTLARSPVIVNFKTRKVEWVPEPEMPARMATMLTNLGATLGLMNTNGLISEHNMRAVYKTAFDSIPADRRILLQLLTKYTKANTSTLAIKLDYPTDTVLSWCIQLNALKMIRRYKEGGNLGDAWELKPEFREVVSKFENIEKGTNQLSATEEELNNYSDEDHTDANDEKLLDQIDWGDWN